MNLNKGFYPFAIVSLLFGIMLFILPDEKHKKQVEPQELLLDIMNDARFMSIYEVTDLIVNKDPSIQLIDVRSPEEYAKFTLPSAINIPLDKIFEKDEEEGYLMWEAYLNQDIATNVFFSNGTISANQVWTLCHRLRYKNNYVMYGGLNKWFDKIIKVEPVGMNATNAEIENYWLRKAMQQFFTGAKVEASKVKTSDVKIPVKRKKQNAAQGGC